MVFDTLASLLSAAVDDERIARNPAKGARLAKAPTMPFVPLSGEQVRAIAAGAALSAVTLQSLSAHIEAFGTGSEGLMFHTQGRPVGRAMASKYIRLAVGAAGMQGHTWHDLRHYHASTLLSAGVSPALVAERLGHDIKTLLATYAHVIRSDEDRVRVIVDEALAEPAEDQLRTSRVE
ncbi:MAG: tyrosine-type recombinase/integrase [Acidimicrobiales bacterium]